MHHLIRNHQSGRFSLILKIGVSIGLIFTCWAVQLEAATHTFSLTTLFDASDVPAPSDPSKAPLFHQAGFVGDEVITLVDESFSDVIGIFRKSPQGSSVETLLDSSGVSPTTGNPFLGPIFAVGDADDLILSTVTTNDPDGFVAELNHYGESTNALTTVIATGEPLPGGSDIVSTVGLNRLSVSQGIVAYRATVNSELPTERLGLFSNPIAGGTTTTLVDTTMSVPGVAELSTFTDFGFAQRAFDGTQAVFSGVFEPDSGSGPERSGIFMVAPGGAPVPLVLPGTNLPGGAVSEPYGFSTPILDEGDILFRASSVESEGIYSIFDETLTLIVDSDTPLPQNPEATFNRFFTGSVVLAGTSIDERRVLFEANGTDGSQGIYLYDQGDISSVLQLGDTIDDLTVAFFDISESSLRGQQFVMNVILVDEETEALDGRVLLATFGSPADLNNDGFVDGLDLGILLGNFEMNAGPSGGELNGTPPVDGLDLGILLGAWSPPPSVLAKPQAVPEPGTLWLLLLTAAAMPRRTMLA